MPAMMRQMLGGGPDATEADPGPAARFFSRSSEMPAAFELMQADEDSGQGKYHWKEYLRLAFHPPDAPARLPMADLRAITAPTLILVGDRAEFCSVEKGVRAYRALAQGELAVVPNTGHTIRHDAMAGSNPYISGVERRARSRYNTTLGFIAARTQRVRQLTLATAASYRDAGVLAKCVTTLHVLSRGRAMLGIGAGDYG
jgi:hypothetical protein